MNLGGLSRRGALPALAALAESDPEPLSATGFSEAAGMAPKNAVGLREDLVLLGIIESKVVQVVGGMRLHEIRLTPLGREVGAHALAIRHVLEKHQTKPEPARRKRS